MELTDHPDLVARHEPPACAACGAGLAGATETGMERRQVTGIPPVARGPGLAAVPAEMTAGHLKLFRRGVTAGLSGSAASPARRAGNRRPGRCWNACGTPKPACSGS